MGRYSTGVTTVDKAYRIELSYLLKNGYIQKGKNITALLNWNDESNIAFHSVYTETECYLRLDYTLTVNATGEKIKYDYKIQLHSVPSNLGKGDVLYFVCPVSGRYSRILYKCYGSHVWKSRESYENRIYYECQLEPKKMRPYKYAFSDWQLNDLYRKQKKSHYKGKPTRIMKRIDKLNRKISIAWNEYDQNKIFQ